MQLPSTADPGVIPVSHERAAGLEVTIRPARAEVFMLSLPMVRTFRSAYGQSGGRKRLIVVRLEDQDGTPGWGEAPIAERPRYCTDTAESTWSALTGLLLPPLIGQSFAGPARVTDTWADVMGQNYARNAVECAAWAIASAKLDVPLSQLWGGVRDAVDVGESFPICDTPRGAAGRGRGPAGGGVRPGQAQDRPGLGRRRGPRCAGCVPRRTGVRGRQLRLLAGLRPLAGTRRPWPGHDRAAAGRRRADRDVRSCSRRCVPRSAWTRARRATTPPGPRCAWAPGGS